MFTTTSTMFMKTLFWFIAFIPPTLLLLLFLFVFKIVRYLIGLCLTFYHGQRVEFLTGLDAMHCTGECETDRMPHTHVTLNGKFDFIRIRLLLQKMCDDKDPNTGTFLHPRLRSTIHHRLGYSYFLLQEKLTLDEHVWVHDGPQPTNNRELFAEFDKLYDRPFFKSLTPPWYFVFFPLAENFPGLDPGPHFVMVGAIHHALSDGLAIVNTTIKYLVETDSPLCGENAAECDEKARPRPKTKPTSSSIWRKLKMAFVVPALTVKLRETSRDEYNLLHRPFLNGIKIARLSPKLSLDRIKGIKNATGTTVNDVMFSLIAGSLRSCFLRLGTDIPNTMKMVMPVAFHDLSKPPTLENKCSFVHFVIPLREETPLARLKFVHNEMNAVKKSPIVISSFLFLSQVINTVPTFSTNSHSELKRQHLVGMISNIPIFQKCFMTGSTVESMFFFSDSKFALNIGIISWNDWFQVRIAADTVIANDESFVDDLLDDFVREMDELEMVVQNLPKSSNLHIICIDDTVIE